MPRSSTRAACRIGESFDEHRRADRNGTVTLRPSVPSRRPALTPPRRARRCVVDELRFALDRELPPPAAARGAPAAELVGLRAARRSARCASSHPVRLSLPPDWLAASVPTRAFSSAALSSVRCRSPRAACARASGAAQERCVSARETLLSSEPLRDGERVGRAGQPEPQANVGRSVSSRTPCCVANTGVLSAKALSSGSGSSRQRGRHSSSVSSTAIAAAPFIGSVPAPTSSRSARSPRSASASVATTFGECDENVESDCAMDCSPNVAKMRRTTARARGQRDRPDRMRHRGEQPDRLKGHVFPPVFGPVTTRRGIATELHVDAHDPPCSPARCARVTRSRTPSAFSSGRVACSASAYSAFAR